MDAVDADGWAYGLDFGWLQFPFAPGAGGKYVWWTVWFLCVCFENCQLRIKSSAHQPHFNPPMSTSHPIAESTLTLCGAGAGFARVCR